MKTIYIAAPYSHPSEIVRNASERLATKYAAYLLEKGHNVFSPLTHSCPISRYTKIDCCDPKFWVELDLYWLQFCGEIHVLKLSGWSRSKGVAREVAEAVGLGLTVRYIDVVDCSGNEIGFREAA